MEEFDISARNKPESSTSRSSKIHGETLTSSGRNSNYAALLVLGIMLRYDIYSETDRHTEMISDIIRQIDTENGRQTEGHNRQIYRQDDRNTQFSASNSLKHVGDVSPHGAHTDAPAALSYHEFPRDSKSTILSYFVL